MKLAMRHAILAALLGAALLAGCGGDDERTRHEHERTTAADAARPTPTDTIKIVDFVYDPTPATVRAGQKISVPNADAAPHTITDAGVGQGVRLRHDQGQGDRLADDRQARHVHATSASFTPS